MQSEASLASLWESEFLRTRITTLYFSYIFWGHQNPLIFEPGELTWHYTSPAIRKFASYFYYLQHFKTTVIPLDRKVGKPELLLIDSSFYRSLEVFSFFFSLFLLPHRAPLTSLPPSFEDPWLTWIHPDNPGWSPHFKVIWLANLIPSAILTSLFHIT